MLFHHLDFFVKLVGKGHCNIDLASKFPLLNCKYSAPAIYRTLRINCLTQEYQDLWKRSADEQICYQKWSNDDVRLKNEYELPWSELIPGKWQWKRLYLSVWSQVEVYS